jgi:hypothetical protein
LLLRHKAEVGERTHSKISLNTKSVLSRRGPASTVLHKVTVYPMKCPIRRVRSPSVGRPCAATALFRCGLPSTHAARPAQSERTPVWNALSTSRLVCRTLLSQRSPAFIHATRPAQRECHPMKCPEHEGCTVAFCRTSVFHNADFSTRSSVHPRFFLQKVSVHPMKCPEQEGCTVAFSQRRVAFIVTN